MVNGVTIEQRKQYFRGVGTGPLDRITGGGFGFGLEQNVRDAYNWLVTHYNDVDIGPDSTGAGDEIFIFGFSRGAYTARSLVGLIATYGILRHGAPLPASSFGNDCVLGRQREKHNGVWERIFGNNMQVPRRITDLKLDPWLARVHETSPPKNRTEELIISWSRRAKITYLGIYDTVGAIGWDSLAIPGLRSKLAMHHNMRPTTLLQKCRHAMAINEQRSSFSHTPFIAYLGPTVSGNELKRARNTSLDGGKECLRTQAMWNRKIEQRWFVGAHSNIGGGYEDNVLAQRPLHWVLEGATKAGLECGTLDVTGWPIYGALHPRDSYEEFANPFWTLILRGKRFYRRIAPPPELRANLDAQDRAQSNGFVLKHVHEELDESVFAYYLPANATVPPNLLEYAGRVVESTERVGKKGKLNNPTYLTRMLAIAQKQCDDRWPGRTIAGTALQIAALSGWSLLAAWGVVVANDLFLTSPQVPLVVVHLAFILICLADIAELTVGFSLARRGGGEVDVQPSTCFIGSAPSGSCFLPLEPLHRSRTELLLCKMGSLRGWS